MRASIAAFLVTLGLSAAAAEAGDGACRHAVAKASGKFVAVAIKSAQRCVAHRGAACRFVAEKTGYAPADSAIAHARVQLQRGLKACADDDVATMGFDGACHGAVGTREALATCLERTHRAAVQALVSVQFPQGTDACGDGVVDDIEDCDPVAVPTGCDTGEACGVAGTDDECTCIPADSCGNALVDAGEQCDPAATPTGCAAGLTCIAAGQPGQCTCSNGNGSTCDGECTPGCTGGQPCVCTCGAVCGDGTVEPGEQCDPLANPSGCAAGLICGAPGTADQCTCFGGTGECGNGQLDPGEGCDPALPNTCDPGEVCLASGSMACQCGAPPANCGNGLIEWGEQCDPAASPTGCGSEQTCGARGTAQACTCVAGGNPMCGNGIVETGEACDPAASVTGCLVGETCTSGCTCSSGATCGDGTVEAGEACDPAANPTGCPAQTTCDATCTCTGTPTNCAISPTPTQLTFTTAVGSGSCGQASGGVTNPISLTCGSLYFGGGFNTTVPPAPAPGGAPTVFAVTSCDGTTLTLGPSGGSGQKDCSRSGCLFGPPLPIRNGPLSTCIVNQLSADANGTVDAGSGTARISLALSSGVFLTQNDAAPCPICSGTCQDGPRIGQSCTPLGSANTSPDCPPGNEPLSSLAVDLTPLTTGSASKTGGPNFCPSQLHPGAFGKTNASTISETGSPASGGIHAGAPATVTLGSTFCIPKTGNGALDPTADLPGPGAISLPGTFTVR